jgi:WD40 repeat protein
MPYDGFISYSHAADGKLAPALQSALQRFAKPWYRRRALRIFRDQTSLAATPELWPTIQSALDDAKYFLLLASPEAAQSKWVRREVAHWLDTKPSGQLLIVLTGGELLWDEASNDFDWRATTALPQELKGAFPSEPLWVDLRWARGEEHLTLKHPRFLEAVGDLAAALRGVPKEDLLGEDVRQHKRALRLAGGAIVALAILLVAALVAAAVALQQRTLAEARTRDAIMQGELALARQLAAQAGNEPTGGLDRRLLLALEANRLNPTGVDSRGSLEALLEAHPRVEAFLRAPTRGSILNLVFAPDDSTLYARAGDREIVAWDVHERRVTKVAPGRDDTSGFMRVALSPHGDILAGTRYTGSGESLVFVDANSFRELGAVLLPPMLGGEAYELAFSSDGRTVAAARAASPASVDPLDVGDVVLVDVASRQLIGGPLKAHGAGVYHVAFSPDSTLLASGGADGDVQLWDVVTRTRIGSSLPTDNEVVYAIAFSPDGRFLAASGTDGVLTVWDMSDGQPGRVRSGTQAGEVFDLAFSADGELLATTNYDGAIRLWPMNGDVLEPEVLGGHQESIETVAFSHRGHVLASGSNDGAVLLWDLDRVSRLARPLRGEIFGISPRGDQVAMRNGDGLAIVDAQREQPLSTIITEVDNDTKGFFSPDGEILATIPSSGPVSVWSTRTGQAIGQLKLYEADAFTALAFSSDSALIATGERDGTVLLWDGKTLDLASPPLSFHSNFVTSLAFSDDDTTLASTSWDGQVQVWDVRIHELLGQQSGAPMSEVAFSPDDRQIVAPGEDGTIHSWDRASMEPQPGLAGGDSGGLWTLAFSPDGKTFASGGLAGQVVLWDAAARVPIGIPLSYGGGGVTDLAFSADGQLLLAQQYQAADDAGSERGARQGVAWIVSVERWREMACQVANRNLTRQEWGQFLGDRPYHVTCPNLPGPVDEVLASPVTADPAGTPAVEEVPTAAFHTFSQGTAAVATPGAGAVEALWAFQDPVAIPPALSPDITLAPDGNLWVVDGIEHGFRVFSPDGALIETWGELGSGEGQFSFRRSFDYLGALAFAPDGSFYVADTRNCRIQQFDRNRNFIRAWGSVGTGDGQFIEPIDVNVDAAGNVYVIDDKRDDIQKFTADGLFLLRFGGRGSGEGQLSSTGSGAIDPEGNFWIADYGNNRLQQFTPEGAFLQSVGTGGTNEGEFNFPTTVAIDQAGNLYVADSGNGRIQTLDKDGTFLFTISGADVGGTELQWLAGVALDGNDNVYALFGGVTWETLYKVRIVLPPPS